VTACAPGRWAVPGLREKAAERGKREKGEGRPARRWAGETGPGWETGPRPAEERGERGRGWDGFQGASLPFFFSNFFFQDIFQKSF